MADSILDAINFFERLPELNEQALRLAINTVADRGALKLARQEILDEIQFPKDYLSGDRLRVTKRARGGDLEAIITARKRATSLARFASGQPLGSASRLGVRVRVGKGNSTALRKAWLVRLRKGASLTEDNYNVGLAVRIKEGDGILAKHAEHHSWLVPGRVALLYGPSVDQVFRDVSEKIAPPVAEMVIAEFNRQLARLTKS